MRNANQQHSNVPSAACGLNRSIALRCGRMASVSVRSAALAARAGANEGSSKR
jgi:hypothetical protein